MRPLSALVYIVIRKTCIVIVTKEHAGSEALERRFGLNQQWFDVLTIPQYT